MARCCLQLCDAAEKSKAYRERAAEWHPDKKSHLDEASEVVVY